MLQEQMTAITQEVSLNLKLDEDQKTTAGRYVRRAVNRILVFCSRDDLPSCAEDIAAQIVEDMLKVDGVVDPSGAVSRISRGDTSIHYQDTSKVQDRTVDFIKDYEAQLIPFKKMKLPADEEGGRHDGS